MHHDEQLFNFHYQRLRTVVKVLHQTSSTQGQDGLRMPEMLFLISHNYHNTLQEQADLLELPELHITLVLQGIMIGVRCDRHTEGSSIQKFTLTFSGYNACWRHGFCTF